MLKKLLLVLKVLKDLEAANKTPEHDYIPWVVVDGKVMSEEDKS